MGKSHQPKVGNLSHHQTIVEYDKALRSSLRMALVLCNFRNIPLRVEERNFELLYSVDIVDAWRYQRPQKIRLIQQHQIPSDAIRQWMCQYHQGVNTHRYRHIDLEAILTEQVEIELAFDCFHLYLDHIEYRRKLRKKMYL